MGYINFITKSPNLMTNEVTFTFDFGNGKKHAVTLGGELIVTNDKGWIIGELAYAVFHDYLKGFIVENFGHTYFSDWQTTVFNELEKEIAKKWDHIPTLPHHEYISLGELVQASKAPYETLTHSEAIKMMQEVQKKYGLAGKQKVLNYLYGKGEISEVGIKVLAEQVLDGKAEISDIKEALNYFKEKDTGLKKIPAKPPSDHHKKLKPYNKVSGLTSVVDQLAKLCPDIKKIRVKCPAAKDCGSSYTPSYISDLVQHLNDSQHNWSREQIADWLETLDADIQLKDRSKQGPTLEEELAQYKTPPF